jgi:hypothetical protein
MDSEASRKARIAALPEEIDFIHYANRLYWRQANADDAAQAVCRAQGALAAPGMTWLRSGRGGHMGRPRPRT